MINFRGIAREIHNFLTEYKRQSRIDSYAIEKVCARVAEIERENLAYDLAFENLHKIIKKDEQSS